MKERVRRSGRRARDRRRHVTKSTRRREGRRAQERVKRKVKRKKEKIKKWERMEEREREREREINKELIALCYSALLASAIFDGANFWVKMLKKMHLLGFAILDMNAPTIFFLVKRNYYLTTKSKWLS